MWGKRHMGWISISASQVVSRRPIDIVLWLIMVAQLAQALKLDRE